MKTINYELAKQEFLAGIEFMKSDKFIQAEEKFKQSLIAIPDRVSTLINLSATQLRLKKYLDAKASSERALLFDNNNVEAYINLGLIEKETKNYAIAIDIFNIVLSLDPEQPECLFIRGQTLYDLKQFDQAMIDFEKALKFRPDYIDCYYYKGISLYNLLRHNEALLCFEKVIDLKKDHIECLLFIGLTLFELKHFEQALIPYKKALILRPDSTECLNNIGNAMYALQRYSEALLHYDKALDLRPNYAECLYNKARVFLKLSYLNEALILFKKTIFLQPNHAESWFNQGVTFLELKDYEEAQAHFYQAMILKPDLDWLLGNLIHLKMRMCNWLEFDEDIKKLFKRVRNNQKTISPFITLALTDDQKLHRKVAESYVEENHPYKPILRPVIEKSPNKKIRIGYFSSDFRVHAVSTLTAELFELHDKNRFEIIAFSFGNDDKSLMRQRLSQSFNQFIDVSNLSDLAIAKLSRENRIDIAIDLGGFTTNSRPDIFSYRAAPIQLSYIGYLGTSGTPYIDYLIADKTIVPLDSQNYYSEKIVYLPSYQVNDRKRKISSRQFSRKDFGLPMNSFVFCCFNNNYKILPSTFDGWMRVLTAVDNSVLFLYAENKWARSNLINEALKRGISSERLVFGEHLEPDEYLARYKICDLFLDTFPYNAGTTASDALWAELPVLTLMGESFASRMAASLLTAIDLPELITSSQEHYEALAIELATNPAKLKEIKTKLESNRLTTPLFDTPRFTKHIEDAYTKMCKRYHADLPPEHIYIEQELSQIHLRNYSL